MTAEATAHQSMDDTAAPGIGSDASPAQSDAVTAPLFMASLGVRWRDLDAFNHVNTPK
jgi:acyl-CoA thioester hydrolase